MTLALGVMTASMMILSDSGSDAARIVIRATARTSVVLFGAAFIASALASLWRHPVSAWLLRNRRYLGMSFGVSHTIHYFAVFAFLKLDPELFQVLGGEIGFEKLAPVIVLALLMATSFDRTAAMMGRRAWKVLHQFGVYFYWVLFLGAFGKRAAGSAFYAGFTVLIIMMMVIRLAATAQRYRQRR